MKYSEIDTKMKGYEHAYRRKLPNPTDYILMRLDGRAFHTFTRGLDRPFDRSLRDAMNSTAGAVALEIQGARAAYTQSDEISLLITSWKDPETDVSKLDVAFGGVEAKLISLSAATASAAFNWLWAKSHPDARLAFFDSRIWTFPGTEEGKGLVKEYFEWRRQDAIRNSISMLAQSHFSPKQLHGVGTRQMLEMLREVGDPWESAMEEDRFGTLVLRVPFTSTVTHHNKLTGQSEEVSVNRNRWELYPATEMDYSFIPDPLQG